MTTKIKDAIAGYSDGSQKDITAFCTDFTPERLSLSVEERDLKEILSSTVVSVRLPGIYPLRDYIFNPKNIANLHRAEGKADFELIHF